MLSDEWVFIVQHSRDLHYQIVELGSKRKRERRLSQLLRALKPVMQVLIPYLML